MLRDSLSQHPKKTAENITIFTINPDLQEFVLGCSVDSQCNPNLIRPAQDPAFCTTPREVQPVHIYEPQMNELP